MNDKYINELRNKLKQAMNTHEHRYDHSIGVAHTAACLAMRYNYDYEKAFIAGLLHDCAKCLSDEQLIKECDTNNITISEYERKAGYLLHGKLGAYYIRTQYGIEDEEILNSVIWHTTGKPNMTLLEKIIYVADFIEPGRNQAGNLDIVRKEAFLDLDRTVYIISRDMLEYLKQKSSVIDTQSIDTFKYYENLITKNND